MATFIVTNTNDSGAGSLRAAVGQANATAGADRIEFAAGVQGGTIRLTTGQIAITDAAGLTIDGGAGVTVTGDRLGDDVTLAGGITDVAGSGADRLDDNSRIFEATAGALTIDSLTLTGGRSFGSLDDGGAVRAAEALTLRGSTVAGNSTVGDFSDGGGVFGRGLVTVSDSTVWGNVTSGLGADGGGVTSYVAVTLTNSTVWGNATLGASASGGGVSARNAVTLTNSTVSGNSVSAVTSYGGGVRTLGALTLTDSIVLGNATTFAGAGLDEFFGFGGLTLIGGNIIGDNAGADRANVFSGAADVGDTTAAAVFSQTVVRNGAVAGVLADNGGPVPTAALKVDATNPALDRSAGGTVAVDARGAAAFDIPGAGATGSGAAVRDLGAFEARPPEAPSLVVTTAADVVDALDGLTSLREAVAFANATAGAQTVTFSAAVFDGQIADVIRLTRGEIAVTDAAGLIIDGGAGVIISGDALGDDALADGLTDLGRTALDRLDDNSRILNATAGALTLDSLTLTGGRSTASDDAGRGGAVRAAGNLTLIDSTVAGNATAGASAYGGGVAAGGTLTLTSSTISDNRTEGSFALGGGAYARNLTATNATVAGNVTQGSTASGGGLYVFAYASLTNSTVTGNAALSASAGGVASAFGVTLTNSIVLGNADANAGALDEVETRALTRQGGNIIGNGAGGADVFSGATEVGDTTAAAVFAQTTTPPGGAIAGLLADNGGPVRTVALRAETANPALDRSGGGAVAVDARGVAAVDAAGAGASGSGAAVRDLGAFEVDHPPEGGSLVVTTAADVVDRFDNLTSLREAVAFANATAGTDTVSFAGAVQGQIAITDVAGLTIDGGAGVTVTGDRLGDDVTLAGGITDVDASGADRLDDNSRIFQATAGALTLEGLTLTGGRTTAAGFANAGGAVRAAGALTVIDSTVAGNSTAGTSTILDPFNGSRVNVGAPAGGGLYSDGSLTLIGSAVFGNRSETNGGGVFSLGDLTGANSAIFENQAQGYGGGARELGSISLTNSTVFGNDAGNAGGGVIASGFVTLTNSTVSGNSAFGVGGISASSGLTLADSIVLGNADGPGSAFDEFESGGPVTLVGGNIIGNGAGGANLFSGATDVGDTDAASVFAQTVVRNGVTAGVLADNGGPVPTVALKADAANLALDRSAGGTVAADARGVAAVDIAGAGAAGAGAVVRDLGAFEVEGVPNRAPTAADDAAATAFETAVAVDVLGNDADPDGDPLAIIAVTQGANGTVAVDDNGTPVDTTDDRLLYTPDAGFSGEDGFSYTVSDGRGGEATATVAVAVAPRPNRAPMAGDDAAATAFETAVTIDVLGNDADPDGEALAIIAVTQAANGTVAVDDNGTPGDATDDRLLYTPDAGFSGADGFSYTVSDGRGGADEATVAVTVASPESETAITFQYLVAREIRSIAGPPNHKSYVTTEFSGARNDVAFEDLAFDSRPDPTRVGDVLVGGSNDVRFREFFAVLNDGGDPGALDAGDRLYRVSNAGSGDRLTTIPQTNQSRDVVNIRAEGVANNNSLGDLNGGIRFGENGFGLDNGPDGEGDARWLNRGDTLVFRLTGADGASDELGAASFTLRTDRASADIGFDADGDGRLLGDANGSRQGGFVEDGGDVFLRGLTDGTRIEVDFGEREVRVNGVVSAADFGALFDEPGRIGLGASLTGGRWAIDDLALGLA